ncbi:MAG: beta-ketoacyl-[acyl-carrier-protein] synthase family protein [Candidatus Schekmanbacteria bacterium]|nr:beta-ketoacyl-[acyl-carrier-protein] synthase family protein [Candidatus Schekmanbacteria bacterium]
MTPTVLETCRPACEPEPARHASPPRRDDRVVVTGIGCVTALGVGVEPLRESIVAGTSGIRPLDLPAPAAPSGAPRLAARLRDFVPGAFLEANVLRRMDDVSRMAVAASSLALSHAGLAEASDRPPADRVGVIMGTSFAAASNTDAFFCGIVDSGPARANPILFPNTVPNAPTSLIAIHWGFKGPNTTFSQKEVSGMDAVAYAMNLLAHRRADVVLAGGGEEASDIMFRCFARLGLLSPGRRGTGPVGLRPFDRTRNGLVLGEGAGVLVLEREADARARGATIWGVLAATVGGAAPCGPHEYDHSGRAWAVVMRQALAAAGVTGGDVAARGWVAATANGSRYLDAAEAHAIRGCFREQADEVAVSALKGMMGALHADGPLRIAAGLLSLRHGVIPPTVGLQEVDPQCGGLDHVIGSARRRRVETVVVSAAAAGGAIRCLVLTAP